MCVEQMEVNGTKIECKVGTSFPSFWTEIWSWFSDRQMELTNKNETTQLQNYEQPIMTWVWHRPANQIEEKYEPEQVVTGQLAEKI